MCRSKKIKQKLLSLYREKVGNISDENEEIPIIQRDALKKAIQLAYPNLRYRNINGLVTIDDFANKIEHETAYREEFFTKALELIRRVTGHQEYTFDSFLFEEYEPRYLNGNKKMSDEANYFIKCQKIYQALARMNKECFHPSSPKLESVKNLRELIDLYYRRGRF